MLEKQSNHPSPLSPPLFFPLFRFPYVALSHLSPLCLWPVLKCDAVSRCKQSSVTGACNSRMVAILAWILTVVAVTSDGGGDADLRSQADAEKEEDH